MAFQASSPKFQATMEMIIMSKLIKATASESEQGSYFAVSKSHLTYKTLPL